MPTQNEFTADPDGQVLMAADWLGFASGASADWQTLAV